jgi:hypothetical protein
MANIASVVPRLDDMTLLTIFRELHGTIAANTMSLQGAGIDHFNVIAPDESGQRVLTLLEKQPSFLITNLGLHYQNLNIVFIRNQDGSRLGSFYDEIKIDHQPNQGGLSQDQRVALIVLLNSKVTLGNVNRRDDAAGKSADDLQAIYHSTILSLQTSFAQQIEKITSWTVEQTTALEHHKLTLTEETAAEREQLRKEYEDKADALRHSAEELESRRRDMDDRAYMHARRGIRGDLQKTIKARQQKFTLTPETTRLRLPLHITMIVLLLALAAANFVALLTILNLEIEKSTLPVLIWAFGKQTIVTLAFVGALFFYIRWMNRWFEQHASAEFFLKQFELDIDRASWVVETAMEWRRDQQAEIPSPLLEGITRNLFADHDHSTAHSAADDLASALVGNASQLKLKMGDNELNFDRKGLTGLGKTGVVT